MKKLKKLSALAISIMMVLSFAGCGDSKDSSKDESSSKAETTTASMTESTSDVPSTSNNESKNEEDSFKDGVYTTSDYSIELGADWKKSESGTISGMAMFKYNKNSATNINILKENAGAEISAEEYKDAAIKQFEGISGYDVTDTKSAEINGNDAYKVYITAEQSSVKLNLIQGYIVNGSDVFVITFTTLADEYDNIKESAEKIIESFKVL